MEENENYEEETEQEGSGSWLKDNLRIIISIIIVVAIAGGVYSYSKRSQIPQEESSNIAEEQIEDEGMIEIEEEGTQTPASDAKQKTAQVTDKQMAPASQETENSFIEAAGRGEGKTHLARRALANYLEKNPDSSLTPEHKIYIEDWLQKNSGYSGRVHIGTSIEFSKDMINRAIESSKSLNDKQLQNLHKYAVRVPSLS